MEVKNQTGMPEFGYIIAYVRKNYPSYDHKNVNYSIFLCLKDTLYWETIEMLGHMVQSIPTQLLLV